MCFAYVKTPALKQKFKNQTPPILPTHFPLQHTANCNTGYLTTINILNAKLNPICHLLALLRARHILHVSRIKFNTVRLPADFVSSSPLAGWSHTFELNIFDTQA
jgi:hypothetical protein